VVLIVKRVSFVATRRAPAAALEVELDAVKQDLQAALEALLVGRQLGHSHDGAAGIAAGERREVGELAGRKLCLDVGEHRLEAALGGRIVVGEAGALACPRSVLDAAGGVGLLLLFAAAMICLGTLIGVIARSPDAVQGIAFMTVFPLTFLSNAFVPAAGLPDGLQQIAEWNPVSAVVAATRTLFGNPAATPADAAWPLQHPVLAGVGWSLLFLAVTAPLAIARFKQRTTE
jgi:hypothetical protein